MLLRASDDQSAEQILDRVRDDDPHAGISLSTVYRTLETATDLHLTSELRGASGISVYEWNDPDTNTAPPGVPRLRHYRGNRSLLAADRRGGDPGARRLRGRHPSLGDSRPLLELRTGG